MIEFIIGLPIIAIVGWIIREVISDRLARTRNVESIKIIGFNKAADAFRAAFINAQHSLRESTKYGNKSAHNILTVDVCAGHEKAKIMFEPFVPASDMEGFNAAWEKYRYGERQNTTDQEKKEAIQELSAKYLEHIENLLKYAKLKI